MVCIAFLLLPCIAAGQNNAAKQNSGEAAEIYLEKLQKQSLSDRGLPIRPFAATADPAIAQAQIDSLINSAAESMNLTPAETEALRKSSLEKIKRFSQRPASPYGNPGDYHLIELWSDKIRRAVQQHIQPQDALDRYQILFGTLPSGQVNAMSIRVPDTNDQYLVVFESGLFIFADLMSLAVSSTFPIESREHGFAVLNLEPSAVIANTKEHPQFQTRFQQIILAYIVEGRFDTLPPSFYEAGDSIHDAVAANIYSAMGLFVLGHEYGHILNGDLRGKWSDRTFAGDRIQQLPHEWNQELAADAIGIKLSYLALAGSRRNLPAILMGADFFLHCYDVVERSASLIVTGKPDRALAGGDHPPMILRRAGIRNTLHDFLRKTDPNGFSEDQWQSTLKEVSQFDRIIDELYAMSEANMKTLHDRNINLAPEWR